MKQPQIRHSIRPQRRFCQVMMYLTSSTYLVSFSFGSFIEYVHRVDGNHFLLSSQFPSVCTLWQLPGPTKDCFYSLEYLFSRWENIFSKYTHWGLDKTPGFIPKVTYWPIYVCISSFSVTLHIFGEMTVSICNFLMKHNK